MTVTAVQLPAERRPITNRKYGQKDGTNKRDLPTRLGELQAAHVENYVVVGDGRLRVREGISEVESFTGTPSMIKFLGSDHIAYAYDDTSNSILAVYKISTDTSTVINTFSSRDDVCGARYGDYFFSSDGTDKIGCFYKDGKFLDYTSASGDFTIGETVTGGTSGATGVIIADDDNGTSGTLVIDTISGTFEAETITGGTSSVTATIAADAYLWYELTNAPTCKHLALYLSSNGTFLVAGNTDTSSGQTQWSEAHIKSNITEIPFLGWSSAALPEPDDAGVTLFNAGGDMNALITYKDFIITFYDDATAAVKIDVVNVDSVGLAQKTIVQHQEFNFGGNSAVATPQGVFYANENGVFQMVLQGVDKLESEITTLLGNDFIEDISFADSEIVWDGKQQLLVFCAENGTKNNLVLCFNIQEGAWTIFRGWNIRRAARQSTEDKNNLYGVDSGTGKIYKLFDGYNDLSLPINTRIIGKKEEDGDGTMVKRMKNLWLRGDLGSTSCLTIKIHSWDKKGELQAPKVFYWGGSAKALEGFGYGKTGYGHGIHSPLEEVISTDNFAHRKNVLDDFLQYQIEITSAAEVRHEVHLMQTEIVEKRRARNNNLSLTKV